MTDEQDVKTPHPERRRWSSWQKISDACARRAERYPCIAVFLVGLLIFGLFNILPFLKESGHIGRAGAYHTHVRLAAALIDGRIEFDSLFYKDIAIYQGHYYSPFPPFPAAFLIPFVLIFGQGLRTMLLTPLLGALTGVILFRMFRKLALSTMVSSWATIAFLFGTVYWLMIREPLDTYFAHVMATGLVFLAIEAAASGRSGVVIGLYIGCAFLSRQLTVLALPFVWVLMLERDATGTPLHRLRPLLATVPGLALCLGLYLSYNAIRFGDPLNCGYDLIVEPGWYGTRMARWGVHHWSYIPSNFVHLFLQGFSVVFNDPHRMIPEMSPSGTSLTFASPFLFLALRGAFTKHPLLNATGWAGIALCTVAVMMNKNAMGGWQINGVRYALDFMPVLLVFAARGMQHTVDSPIRRIWQGAIVYSVALNVLAIGVHYLPRIATLLA